MSRITTDQDFATPSLNIPLSSKPNSWNWFESTDFSAPRNFTLFLHLTGELKGFVESLISIENIATVPSATFSDSWIAGYFLIAAKLIHTLPADHETRQALAISEICAALFIIKGDIVSKYPCSSAAAVLLNTSLLLNDTTLATTALSGLTSDGLSEFIRRAPTVYQNVNITEDVRLGIAQILLYAYGRLCTIDNEDGVRRDRSAEREIVCSLLDPITTLNNEPIIAATARLLLRSNGVMSEKIATLADLDLEKISSKEITYECYSILYTLKIEIPASLIANGLNNAAETRSLSKFIAMLALVRGKERHDDIFQLLTKRGKSLLFLVAGVKQSALDKLPDNEGNPSSSLSNEEITSLIIYNLCNLDNTDFDKLTFYECGAHATRIYQEQGRKLGTQLRELSDGDLAKVAQFVPLMDELSESCVSMTRRVVGQIYEELLSRVATRSRVPKILKKTLLHAAAVAIEQDSIDSKEDSSYWRSPLRSVVQTYLEKFYQNSSIAVEVHNEWFGTNRSGANAYYILNSLRVMARLEDVRKGMVDELTKKFGIMMFGRYSIGQLKSQSEILAKDSASLSESVSRPTMVILGITDHNLSMRNLTKRNVYLKDTLFFEANSPSRFTRACRTYKSLFRAAQQINIHTHASSKNLALGYSEGLRLTALDRPVIVKLLRNIIEDNGVIVLDGCKLAEKFLKKTADALAEKGVTIYACDGVSSLISLRDISRIPTRQHIRANFATHKKNISVSATKILVS